MRLWTEVVFEWQFLIRTDPVSSCPPCVALLTQSMCFPYIQQQGRQCTCYVTLWRVRITIVTMRTQHYFLCVQLSHMSSQLYRDGEHWISSFLWTYKTFVVIIWSARWCIEKKRISFAHRRTVWLLKRTSVRYYHKCNLDCCQIIIKAEFPREFVEIILKYCPLAA